jgi:hypothetical protein
MGMPGYVLPLEGFQVSHRLPHTLVLVMTEDPPRLEGDVLRLEGGRSVTLAISYAGGSPAGG